MFKRPKGSKPIPKNARGVEVARKTIEFLGATSQRQLQNAITGDGRHCLLYMPRANGIKCTCSNDDPLDTDGKMRHELMHSILSNSNAETIPYKGGIGAKNDVNQTIGSERDTGNLKTTDSRPKFGSAGYSTQVFSLEDLDDENFDADKFDLKIDVGFQEEPIPELQNGYVPTTSFSASACPICLGTGWVGGFDLYGGTRLVLPASSAQYEGCKLVNGVNGSADYAEMAKDTSLVFNNLMLPRGVTRIDEIAMWNGRDQVPFNLSVDNQTLSDIFLLGDYFNGTTHNLKFSPVYNTTVTHVTIQYANMDILIDISKKTISNNNSLYDQQTEVTLVLPAVTQRDLKGAIVYDSTEHKLYRVATMNTSNTQGGWVQMLDLDARIVQPYELANLLPKMNSRKIKKFGGSFNNTSSLPRNFY